MRREDYKNLAILIAICLVLISIALDVHIILRKTNSPEWKGAQADENQEIVLEPTEPMAPEEYVQPTAPTGAIPTLPWPGVDNNKEELAPPVEAGVGDNNGELAPPE